MCNLLPKTLAYCHQNSTENMLSFLHGVILLNTFGLGTPGDVASSGAAAAIRARHKHVVEKRGLDLERKAPREKSGNRISLEDVA
jgi:hypothetical protein